MTLVWITLENRLDEWRSLAEYMFHLAQYGENAPGGDETYREAELRMRALGDIDLDRPGAHRDPTPNDPTRHLLGNLVQTIGSHARLTEMYRELVEGG